MANKRYNNQLFKDLKSKGVIDDKTKVKDLKKISTGIERPKKMAGGMMKRKMLNSGSKPKPDFLDIDKDKNFKESFKSAAKSIKKTSGGMRANKKEKAGMKSGVGKLNKGLRKFLAKKGSK